MSPNGIPTLYFCSVNNFINSKTLIIMEKVPSYDLTQIDPVINTAYKAIKDAIKYQEEHGGIPTLFHKHKLDRITSEWQDSDLIIIAARPAMGKTAFALSMARNLAINQRFPIAFFSLELGKEQLIYRLISNVCEIEVDKLRSGLLQPDELTRLNTKITRIYGKPLYIDYTPSISFSDLCAKAHRLVCEQGVRMIIIDYLQLMTSYGSGIRFNNREEELSYICRSLKDLAKELNTPVIVLSQLPREVAMREGEAAKRPQLSDLREYGTIEQNADFVCFLHRPEYYNIYRSADNSQNYRGKAEFIFAKHRNGKVGIVMLKFKPQFSLFMNLEDADEA